MSRKTCAIFRVILITLLLCLHYNSALSEEQRIAALKNQLRGAPRDLLIVTFYDSKNVPSWIRFQSNLDIAASEYKEEIGLTVNATAPLPLTVQNIHSLTEIRTIAQAEYPWVTGALIMFVTDSAGPIVTEESSQNTGSSMEASTKTLEERALYCKEAKTIVIYSSYASNAEQKKNGKTSTTVFIEHEIGHHIGLSHNDSEHSFMNSRCDKSFGQWTAKDYEEAWNGHISP